MIKFLSAIIPATAWVLSRKHFDDAAVKRDFFYVGGEYHNIDVENTSKTYMLNQIYVEKLTPPNPTKAFPIVFIHGSAQTGTNWLDTPDGRRGWASFFNSQGYTVYLSDQPSRGRSAWHPLQGSMIELSTWDIETHFTATAEHDRWPQSKLHTQWPGSGKAGDPTFDAFFAAQVQLQADEILSEATNAKAYTALLDHIGDAIVITHSQSGAYGWQIGNARPKLVKGIVALEPAGPPFVNHAPIFGPSRPWGLTNLAIEYDPPAGPNASEIRTIEVAPKDNLHFGCVQQQEPAKRLKHLSKIPVLVATGEASYHAQYDYCTVAYLRQAGVDVEYADLGEEGIHGNGHMMFMEMNNIEIAKRVERWLEKVL